MSEDHETGKELNEDALEKVAGGGRECEGNCYFLPTKSTETRLYDNAIYARCRSECFGAFFAAACSCHGSPRCKDKYHQIEAMHDGLWGPSPLGENNHSAPDKSVKMT